MYNLKISGMGAHSISCSGSRCEIHIIFTAVKSYLGSQTRDEWGEGSHQRGMSREKAQTGRYFLYESDM
jgi:hypothetical protein